jgi:Flp pilus assembly protein TadB
MEEHMSELFFSDAGITALSLLIILLDFTAAIAAAYKLNSVSGIDLTDIRGGRNDGLSIYAACRQSVRETVDNLGDRFVKDRTGKAGSYFAKTVVKMKKSGYQGESAAIAYILIKYPVAFITAFLALILNYPAILPSISVIVLLQVIPEIVLVRGKKATNMEFQRYIYKIYKYLHNQVSSGVRVADAIRTVYEVVDDRRIRNMFIRTAARYELTLDIDASLEEFRECFDAFEADMLCTALRQGLETGDNSELLARQEDMMFKKYFNYIQSETDGCKNRSLLAAAMYTAIVVLMITIPMINDVSDAVGRIFIN